MVTEDTRLKKESAAFCRYSSSEYAQVSQNEYRNLALGRDKPRLLMHACCGPCATACVERLADDYSITVFYYNPNITDEKEYFLRRDALTQFIDAFNRDHPDLTPVSYIEGDYAPETFIRKAGPLAAEPEGGRRCNVCFEIRLAETARVARELAFDCFTTTLTVSPHKDFKLISEIGTALGQGAGVEYLAIDFKKKNGFQRSIELSKQYGLYRQNFCGCEYARR